MRSMRPMQTVRRSALPMAMCVALSCTSSDGVPREVENVRAPTVIHRVAPEYPAELRQERVVGVVVISGTVPKEGGALRNPRVVRSDDLRLNQLALDAVARWIWKPGLQHGKPVDVEFTTPVRFSVGR